MLNLVLSYGDLARPGGYRTRVLGELHALDRQNDLDPFLLVFDRNPSDCEKSFNGNISRQVLHRSSVLQFYKVTADLTRKTPVQLVHAHNLYSAALALSGRRRFGYKVVLDYHGRIPEEYVYLGKGGMTSRRVLESLERWCVQRSDHVIVVSHKLAYYLVDRYHVSPQKISVIPCCADDSIFNWDNSRREAVRSAMNLSTKFVCTHLGSFFEWYDPEMIANVFQQIRNRRDAHLLVITGECEKAGAYLSARLPVDTFTVRHAAHDEVPGLLNASDLGLLLLRGSPNIKTSSPAKFAEYLNCGLPVLITQEVGDFSEMVTAKQIGAVVNERDDEKALVDRAAADRAQIAAQCVAAGQQLTWRAYSSTWSRIASSR
jgi:glycosyltransferase involved in cell wall biosynthesis